MKSVPVVSGSPRDLEKHVLDVFRLAGWSVEPAPRGPDPGVDAVVRRSKHTYVVQIKTASEGRADRLVPLLAQAILEARVGAHGLGRKAVPLAIVAARRLPRRIVEQLSGFARVHAPDVAFGVVDSSGFRHFSGPGLEPLNARPNDTEPIRLQIDQKVDLFSDLNQWLLKVLLAPALGEPNLLNAPADGNYQNATQLATAARVSVMTAFRFLRELAAEGFLREKRLPLRLVRVEELLHRWQAAALRPAPEINARWILSGDRSLRVKRAVAAQGERACVALFAAAEALGLGFVRGAVTHIYVSDLGATNLAKMGLLRTEPGQSFDVALRMPSARESVFRGAVQAGELRSCDVLQVWLDVANHPSRGNEQAQLIYKRVLMPMIGRARDVAR